MTIEERRQRLLDAGMSKKEIEKFFLGLHKIRDKVLDEIFAEEFTDVDVR